MSAAEAAVSSSRKSNPHVARPLLRYEPAHAHLLGWGRSFIDLRKYRPEPGEQRTRLLLESKWRVHYQQAAAAQAEGPAFGQGRQLKLKDLAHASGDDAPLEPVHRGRHHERIPDRVDACSEALMSRGERFGEPGELGRSIKRRVDQHQTAPL